MKIADTIGSYIAVGKNEVAVLAFLAAAWRLFIAREILRLASGDMVLRATVPALLDDMARHENSEL